MITRKIFPFIISVFMVLFYSSSAQAEFFSVSAGVPVSHSFSNSDLDSDGVSGYLVHFKLPIMIGLGMEAYETKINYSDATVSDMKLATNMYDIFWLTPIPVINFTIGVGAGTAELSCTVINVTVTQCSDYYEKGTATQFWAQLGFNPVPLIDFHVSYHNVSSGVKSRSDGSKFNVGGTVYAVGASIIF